MTIDKKINMFLMGESKGAKLTPYAKSFIRYQDVWTKEDLDNVVMAIAKNAANTDYRYEVSFGHGAEGKTGNLTIYRRGDDVLRRKMDDEGVKAFLAEIKTLLQGTGLKIVGDKKSADWVAAIVSK